jgi:hypothetical protein
MKQTLTTATFLVFLGLHFQSVAFALQTGTGDWNLDYQLGKINELAKAENEGWSTDFIRSRARLESSTY